MSLSVFVAGDGINVTKLNNNFSELQNKTNANENAINNFDSYALRKDGSNLTQSIVADFQKQIPNIRSGLGEISLSDNTSYFLTLTGDHLNRIKLPTVADDQYSHTINLVVEGSSFPLHLGTIYYLYNDLSIDTTKTYNILYIYNKIDRHWYCSITQ